MNNTSTESEIKRLNFEDFLWIIFIAIALLNIFGDYNEKEYLKSNDKYYKNKANSIFEIALFTTFLIYIYFNIRNYNSYKKAPSAQKGIYQIKLFGSTLLIVGVLCLIYFQHEQTSFIGSPA